MLRLIRDNSQDAKNSGEAAEGKAKDYPGAKRDLTAEVISPPPVAEKTATQNNKANSAHDEVLYESPPTRVAKEQEGLSSNPTSSGTRTPQTARTPTKTAISLIIGYIAPQYKMRTFEKLALSQNVSPFSRARNEVGSRRAKGAESRNRADVSRTVAAISNNAGRKLKCKPASKTHMNSASEREGPQSGAEGGKTDAGNADKENSAARSGIRLHDAPFRRNEASDQYRRLLLCVARGLLFCYLCATILRYTRVEGYYLNEGGLVNAAIYCLRPASPLPVLPAWL